MSTRLAANGGSVYPAEFTTVSAGMAAAIYDCEASRRVHNHEYGHAHYYEAFEAAQAIPIA